MTFLTKPSDSRTRTLADWTAQSGNLYLISLQAKRELEQLVSKYGLPNESPTRTDGCSRDVCRPHVLKPLVIVSVFYVVQVISGTYLVIFYAVDIVAHAGISDGLGVDRYFAAVITAAVRLLFAILMCFLLRCTGRRPLVLVAGSLQAISALSVGTFLYMKDVINITDYEFPARKPIVTASMLAYVASNACSYFSMPGTAMAELLPDKLRGYLAGYILAGTYLGFFVTAKFFPWLCNLLEVHGVFGVFGVTTAIGTFIMYLLLPESSGKSLLQIQNYFCQPNIMWVGRNMVLRRTGTKPKTECYEMQVKSWQD